MAVKRCVPVIVILMMCLAFMPVSSRAGESFDRIGFAIGGINIIGLYYEHGTENVAVRAQVGYMIHAVSVNIAAVHYFDTDSRHSPYAGLGVIKHFNGLDLSGDTIISIPLGDDIDLSGDQFVAVELLPAVSLSAMRPHHDGKRLFDYILPLPCLYYKYRL